MLDEAIAHYRLSDGTPHPLHEHLRGVSCLAGSFAAKVKCQLAGELIGLAHDFGKYSAQFQAYLGSAVGLLQPDDAEYMDSAPMRGRIDHSTAGAQALWQEMSGRGTRDAMVAQILATCIASHHSGLIDLIGSDKAHPSSDNFSRRMKKPSLETHLDEVRVAADPSVLARLREIMESPQATAAVISHGPPRSGRDA